MPYLLVQDFARGIDRRRLAVSSLPGSLQSLTNAHITRGGEIEKRRAFVSFADLPANTFGLHSNPSAAGLYVFGSATAPSMPAGVTYQRLQSSGGWAMTGIKYTVNFGTKIYAIAEFTGGVVEHFFNGVRITDWDTVTSSIASLNNLAAAFRAAIGASANYSTSGSGADVTIEGEEDINWKAKLLAVDVDGTDDQHWTVTVVTPFTPGGKKKKTFTLAGTFDASDVWTIKLIQPDGEKERFVFQGTAGAIGTTALVKDGKVYATAQTLLYFSQVHGPKHWSTHVNGAGFINMTTEEDLDVVTALGVYQGKLAVFGKRTIQIWHTDPDPDLNRRLQVLKETGTIAPRSVAQFGDIDLFYLDHTGVRSVRARDVNNTATVSDIGSPIDNLIAEDYPLKTSESARIAATTVFEPIDGRFWLAIGTSIYVFSYFPGTKIQAWGKYIASYASGGAQQTFTVSDMAQLNGIVYVRGGDKIFAYGGTQGTTYDACEVEAELPLIDAGKPADRKKLKSVDISAEGNWKVFLGSDSTNPAAREQVGDITGSSWGMARIPAVGLGTHFSVKVKSSGSGRCVLGALALDYDVANR